MKNIFEAIPDRLEDEFFQQIQAGENIRIERIVSLGHRSPQTGWYDQDQNEWVLVLKGAAVLSFDGGIRLRALDRCRILDRCGRRYCGSVIIRSKSASGAWV